MQAVEADAIAAEDAVEAGFRQATQLPLECSEHIDFGMLLGSLVPRR